MTASSASHSAPGKGGFARLCLCIAGIYTCYLLYGMVQEGLYRRQEDGSRLSATAFVLAIQCVMNAAVAVAGEAFGSLFTSAPKSPSPAGAGAARAPEPAETGVTRSGRRLRAAEAPSPVSDVSVESAVRSGTAPAVAAPASLLSKLRTADVMQAAFVYVFAMYTSNEALQYVSYPMQALAKSCKLIPVLLGSIFLLKKRYRIAKYVCVVLMTLGITMFQMGKSSGGKHGSKDSSAGGPGEAFGLGLLVVSLVLDGVTGPLQEKLTTNHGLKNMRQMLVNNIWASAYMFALCALTGQLGGGIQFFADHPALVRDLVLFGLCSGFGQIFIFYTIRSFDSLVLSTITTTRKFFTILVSVLDPRNGHSLSSKQWAAVAVVFAGVGLEVYDGEMDKRQKRRLAAAAGAAADSDSKRK